MPSVATQAERRAATRSQILAAARRRFTEMGFEGASVDAIAQAARVSKGAVYHHFSTKEDLFRAVFEQVEAEVADLVAARSSTETTPPEMLQAGCHAFLESALDAAIRRILFDDGPRVLGWEVWREIDEQHFLALIVAALRLHDPDRAEKELELRAHLLLGAVDEAAMLITRAPNPDEALNGVVRELDAVIVALLSPAPADGTH